MITRVYEQKMVKGEYKRQFTVVVSDRLYTTRSRIRWSSTVKPTQRQIRKMRRLSFFYRKRIGCGLFVFSNKDLNEEIQYMRQYFAGEW